MRIVSDHHHGVLFESFQMLFSDRAILGPAEVVGWADGHYHQPQPEGRWPFHSDFPLRSVEIVSSDWLREHGADILIGTTSTTRQPLKALAAELGALYVDQLGNEWDGPLGAVVLRAMTWPGDPGIGYHPEFHRRPWSVPVGHRVGSFHTSFVTSPCRRDWDRVAGPEWVMYGTAESPLHPWQVAAAREECVAIWNCKDQDGYGFAVHEAFAAGRPVIGHAKHYDGKLARDLFVRGVTYLEPEDDLAAMLANPEPMGRAAYDRFAALVDFDAEADAIRSYLEVLLR